MTIRTCVIYNPVAGRGRAERLLKELPPQLIKDIELRPSQKPGHSTELAREAAEAGFGRIIAAGGDGTVHEVANGILQSGQRKGIFSIWPIGSANDYAYALGLIEWWKKRDEQLPLEALEVDVGRVTTPGREVYVVGCLGVGFNGMVTIEARKCQWLKGMPLYAWAFLKAMVKHFAKPKMRIRFDDREIITPTLALSVLNGQREGNFPLRPAARLTDGWFDYMHATRLNRIHLIRYLPAMATGNLPENHPLLHLGRAKRIEVQSESPLCVHADGEFVCIPSDGVREVTVEVIPSRLCVEVYRPALHGGRN
jgi:YegS/Rv2252/BmrU family lipid kinase